MRYFTENAEATPEQRNKILAGMSPARRQKLEESIRQWQSLQPQRREKLLSQFNQFFDLNTTEKQQALKSLSEPERKQIERTLRSYQSLSYQQRAQCLKSFDKFASLPLKERQQFLKNAERWTLMTPRKDRPGARSSRRCHSCRQQWICRPHHPVDRCAIADRWQPTGINWFGCAIGSVEGAEWKLIQSVPIWHTRHSSFIICYILAHFSWIYPDFKTVRKHFV